MENHGLLTLEMSEWGLGTDGLSSAASRLKEAIPPAYAKWVGHQFLSQH